MTQPPRDTTDLPGASSDDDVRFAELAVRYLADALDAAGVDELTRLLDADPERTQLLTVMSISAESLRRHGPDADVLATQSDEPASAVATPASPKPRAAAQRGPGVSDTSPIFRIPRSIYALAAAVLLFAAAVTIYLAVTSASNSPLDTPNAKPGSPVATVLDTTDGGTLLADGQLVQPGATVSSGELTLDRGSASVEFTNGVALTVHDAARLIVHDPMHATLAAGAADFHVPSNATGFTVDLPDGSRIVDLGTRFRVRIADDARVELRVIDGRVNWIAAGPDARPVPVAAGEAVRIDAGALTAMGAHAAATVDDYEAHTVDPAWRLSRVHSAGPGATVAVDATTHPGELTFHVQNASEHSQQHVLLRDDVILREPGDYIQSRVRAGGRGAGVVIGIAIDQRSATPADRAGLVALVINGSDHVVVLRGADEQSTREDLLSREFGLFLRLTLAAPGVVQASYSADGETFTDYGDPIPVDGVAAVGYYHGNAHERYPARSVADDFTASAYILTDPAPTGGPVAPPAR